MDLIIIILSFFNDLPDATRWAITDSLPWLVDAVQALGFHVFEDASIDLP